MLHLIRLSTVEVRKKWEKTIKLPRAIFTVLISGAIAIRAVSFFRFIGPHFFVFQLQLCNQMQLAAISQYVVSLSSLQFATSSSTAQHQAYESTAINIFFFILTAERH